MRTLTTIMTAVLLVAGSATGAYAAPCKDAKGKFIKCPPAAPKKAARCKYAKGKFAKCGTPGAKPV